jgi:hypothetical protein
MNIGGKYDNKIVDASDAGQYLENPRDIDSTVIRKVFHQLGIPSLLQSDVTDHMAPTLLTIFLFVSLLRPCIQSGYRLVL